MAKIRAEKIDQKPWEYILYKIDQGGYILTVPYSPKSFVDAKLNLKLSVEECELVNSDPSWVRLFAEKVRNSPSKYLSRSLSPDVF